MSYLKQANEAFRKKNYQMAVDLYQKALEEVPLLQDMVGFNLKVCCDKLGGKRKLQLPERQVEIYSSQVASISQPEGKKNSSFEPAALKHKGNLKSFNKISCDYGEDGNLTVLQMTPSKPRNPFYTMINDELVRCGASFHYTVDRDEALRLAKRIPSLIVHFHQLEPFYHPGEKTPSAVAERAESLLEDMRKLKAASAKLIWTKHNPLPHDGEFPWIDVRVERAALELVDRVVLLSEGAAREHAEHDEKLAHVPHPEFKSVYGSKVEKNLARKRLGLPENAYIFACVGELKPYKRHLMQIEAFKEFCARYSGGKEPFLLFVGNPGPLYYVTSLTELGEHRIRIIPKNISNDEMRYWMSAIDISLFAFERIWVSGSVLLSLSYDVPVIAPNIGYLDEYVSHENTGYFYEPGDTAGMASAMMEAIDTPYRAHLEYMCGVFRKKCSIAVAAEGYRGVFLEAYTKDSSND